MPTSKFILLDEASFEDIKPKIEFLESQGYDTLSAGFCYQLGDRFYCSMAKHKEAQNFKSLNDEIRIQSDKDFFNT